MKEQQMKDKDEISITTNSIILAKPIVVLQEDSENWGILYNPETDFSFAVNPMSAFIWKCIESKISINDIREKIFEHFSSVSENVEQEIIQFAKILVENNLASLEESIDNIQKKYI